MTATIKAPGTRYIASAFGSESWISSRAGRCMGSYGLTKEYNGEPITHALAMRNAFGAVMFSFFTSCEEAESAVPETLEWQIVETTSRPETAADL